MPDDLKTKIVRVTDAPLLNPLGGITPRYRITYMLGEHGPYSIELPAAGFTAEKAKAAVEEAAAPIRALLQG
jgi:hypothetical protein